MDRIDCGSGTDTVTADRNDILVDCEKVTFRPSGPSAASVATRKLNANRKRTKAPVALSCSDAATRCTGRITVTTGKGKRRTLLARGRYSLAAGASGKVRLTLTEAARKHLRRKARVRTVLTLKANRRHGRTAQGAPDAVAVGVHAATPDWLGSRA